jgi:hypothetical protein
MPARIQIPETGLQGSDTDSKKKCDKMASYAMGLKVECLKVESRRIANSELTFDL